MGFKFRRWQWKLKKNIYIYIYIFHLTGVGRFNPPEEELPPPFVALQEEIID